MPLERLWSAVSSLWRAPEAPDLLAFPRGFEFALETGDVLVTCASRMHLHAPSEPIRFSAYYQNRRDEPTRLTLVFAPEGVPEVELEVPVGGAEVGLVWQDVIVPDGARDAFRWRVFGRTDGASGKRVRSRGGFTLPWRGLDVLDPVDHALHPDTDEPMLSPAPLSKGHWRIWTPGTSVELARERFLGAIAITHECIGAGDLPPCLREDEAARQPWQRWVMGLYGLLCGAPEHWHSSLVGHCPAHVRDAIAQWWGVTDVESARDCLRSLVKGRHGERFREARARVADLGASAAQHGDAEVRFVHGLGAGVPPQEIRAWDVGRIVSLTLSTYTAGYMSEAEAWRWLLTAAREAQVFDSWRAWGESYALGHRFWLTCRGDLHEADEVQATLQRFLTDPRSPWTRIPWYSGPLPGAEPVIPVA